MTQAQQILVALRKGRKLTPIDALREFGCLSLSQRVGEMIRKGHPIVRSRLQIGEKRVGHYWLPKGGRK